MDDAYVIMNAAQCGFADWQTIWGDPWISGTVLVLAYALAGVSLFHISRHLERREKTLWRLCGLILLLQAVNTPLDIHAFGWTFLRCLSHAQGWYGSKVLVKTVLFGSALGLAAASLLCALVIFRKHILNNIALICGVGLAVGMTAAEAIPVAAISKMLHARIGWFTRADLIELLGIMIVGLALVARRKRLLRAPSNP